MMALQQFVCCFTVLIIFFCKGCHSQQPACGSRAVNSSSNITGPTDAAPGSWPWFADIKAVGVFNGLFGGSLINEQWVLTDAFAPTFYQLDSSSLVVYLGRNSLSGPNPNEVNRTVVNITCHPGYNSSTLENDICLLKLSAPVNFTDYIWPICLASGNSTFNNETSSWAIGFGILGGIFSNNLQEAKVPIVGNNVCTASRPGITDSIICIKQTDSCLLTLGAPLMTQSGSVWLQSGVLIVPGCISSPSVYTPVSQYQKWISDTVTGTPPGFVTFPSPHSSLQTTAPPTAPSSSPPTAPPTTPSSAPPTAVPTTPPTAPPTTPSSAPPTAAPTTPSSAPPTAAPTTPPTAAPTTPSSAPPTAAPTTPPTAPPTTPSSAPPTDAPTTPSSCSSHCCSHHSFQRSSHCCSHCCSHHSFQQPPTAPPTTPSSAPPTTPPTAAPTTPSSAPPTAPPTTPPTAPPTTPSSSPPTAPPTTPSSAPPTAAPTTPSSAPPTAAPTTPPTAAPTTPSSAPPTAPPTTPSSAPPTTPPTAAPTTPSSAPPTAPSTTPPTAPPTASPTTAPTTPSTTPSSAPPTAPPTTPPTAPPTTCVGVFCSGENLIHFTHFTSLCVLVVLLHVFAAAVGN
ncbi:mucin-2-like [Oreochromis aureus]|uniref:mucin-2-like n=1 Tax=Oreochromis aureus TaxID=47969 RepID=UPI001953F7D1|nr:mucin-2-like [Oreochromis aureus]